MAQTCLLDGLASRHLRRLLFLLQSFLPLTCPVGLGARGADNCVLCTSLPRAGMQHSEESHYYPALRILIMYAVYRQNRLQSWGIRPRTEFPNFCCRRFLAETFNVAALPMMILLATALVPRKPHPDMGELFFKSSVYVRNCPRQNVSVWLCRTSLVDPRPKNLNSRLKGFS